MSNEMVDRVAGALDEARDTWLRKSDECRGTWREFQARAAIAGMREPTEAMLLVANEIEVTHEMIEEGTKIVWSALSDSPFLGPSFSAPKLVAEVYLAMDHSRRKKGKLSLALAGNANASYPETVK